jgi:hypothetical protein
MFKTMLNKWSNPVFYHHIPINTSDSLMCLMSSSCWQEISTWCTVTFFSSWEFWVVWLVVFIHCSTVQIFGNNADKSKFQSLRNYEQIEVRNSCCHLVHNLLSSSLLSKNIKIKIYRIISCLLFCMGVKLGRSHWGKNVGWGCLRIGNR